MASFASKRTRSRVFSFLRRKTKEPSDPQETPAALAAYRNEEAFRLNADIGRIESFENPSHPEEPASQTCDLQVPIQPIPIKSDLPCASRSTTPSQDEGSNGTSAIPVELSAEPAEETQPAAACSPYQPLEQARTEIRVLHVKAGRAPEPLRCEMRTVSLTAEPKPEYESISYCWGDPSPSEPIMLNDIETRIPPNAKVVLERVRYPECDRVVWIDAICINQKDEEEKQSQVGLMSEVYSYPTMNLIWLGEDEGDTDQVLAIIEQIVGDAREETDDFRTFEETTNSPPPSTGRVLDLQTDISPLLRFYKRRWFERVWCVQEAALAPDSMCHCGSYEVSLVDVMRAAQWLSYKRFLITRDLEDSKGIHNIISISPMMDLGRQGPRTTHQRKTALYWLLRRLQNFEASNPRDHVFGLLGMYLKFTGREKVPGLLAPDYSKSVAEVFRDATRFAIQMIPSNLPVFSYINPDPPPDQGSKETGWFPSWVPQWHSSPLETRHPPDLPTFYNCADGVWVYHMKSADADPNVLSLRGIAVDGVLTTSVVIEGRRELLYNARRVAGRGLGAKLGRTLMAGANAHGQPASDREALDYFKPWTEHFLSRREPPTHGSLLQELHGSAGEHSEDMWRVARWDEASKVSLGRRFFKTHSGFIGIGPRSMEKGDIVAIVYGCRWPVVLRPCAAGWGENVPGVPGHFDYHLAPQPEGYRILGVCYVDGIMFGEYVREFREQKRTDMVFDLR